MPRSRGHLLTTPPSEVDAALVALGYNLRTARVRRNLTLVQMAEALGVSREVLGEAEKGKASTSIAVYAGLLWRLGMIEQLGELARPDRDEEGQRLASFREPKRARPAGGPLDDDF
ncbi:helix-turn-helix transcriptional regulator [Caulobacter endophyticus]|uniref:HTH cro/C1-type domain-containing protein n=1 Tax=Caulobacter endophyticus TaxID=2172652 RepID=A0A2T9KCC9_9CAUL|nr:helix-turn-helix transcriptional regulator [Caulobacter endophyticus]PVM93630.1 hypothetical protein DDF67_02780 [Caulobacter endophyticus]